MSGTSLISDDLFGQLMAVGQADVLVGLPTLNNATTVGRVARAAHRSFATHFRRERTVLLSCDGGSTDGTPEIVRDASIRDDETLVSSQPLRTIHRLTFPYHGLPGKAGALRTLFAAAELLQPRALAVLDAEVTTVTAQWVERLVRPVFEGTADFVAPVFERRSSEAPLLTQLVRPLFGAAYGRRFVEPLASEFACSGAFAAHCRKQAVWETPLARNGIDLWLTGTAVASGFRCAQAGLGPRTVVPGAPRPQLPEAFLQVVGSLLGCLELHESYWLPRVEVEDVPILGDVEGPAPETPPIEPGPMVESFRRGVADLAPILRAILSEDTLSKIKALASPGDDVFFEDELWARTVGEAAGAFRRSVMHRDHLVQALVPIYLGRAASFLRGDGAADSSGVLEALCRAFEATRPELVRLWTAEP
jgi:hypothetical protein